jgi:hypothetical protein
MLRRVAMVHPSLVLKCLKVPSFHLSIGEPSLSPLNRDPRDRGKGGDFATSFLEPTMVNSTWLQPLKSPCLLSRLRVAFLALSIDED